MPSERVDVLLARAALPTLALPSRSIVLAGPAVVTRVRARRTVGLSRTTLDLPVDAPTAARFASTDRWQKIWWYGVFPVTVAVLLIYCVFFVLDEAPMFPIYLLFPILAGARLTMDRRVSPHHPVRERDGDVRVPGVPAEVAWEWQQRNPPGAVEIRPTAVRWVPVS